MLQSIATLDSKSCEIQIQKAMLSNNDHCYEHLYVHNVGAYDDTNERV